MNGLALCAGIGGIELGLSLVVPGYRTVGYVERDAYAAATLVARMEDEALDQAPIWDDITTFDGTAWRGVVDIVTAGFPCQPWSQAGARKGADDERWIWADIERVIREVESQLVFLENVPGLVSGGGLAAVLGSMAALGYDAEWGVFSAAGSGARHLRRRVFILANTNSTRLEEREAVARPRATCTSAISDGATDRWREWWAVEPDVGRVAHGTPARVDSLRCLGNAVVPIVAARAFVTLWERMTGGAARGGPF